MPAPNIIKRRAPQHADGSFTCDGTDARQIPTGFKCAIVVLHRATSDYLWIIINSTSALRVVSTTTLVTTARLHAANGFIVDGSIANYPNNGAVTDSWWALEDTN